MKRQLHNKPKLTRLLRRYPQALGLYLAGKPGARLVGARDLGREAVALRLETLDIARIHEHALLAIVPTYTPDRSQGTFRRAANFFSEVVTPIEKTHRSARRAFSRLKHLNKKLRRRAADLALSNRRLRSEMVQRKAAEVALRKSERHQADLLRQSRELQDQLRRLSHQLLSAEEEERKRISRELHDGIVQTLAGINVQLAALKAGSGIKSKDLARRIKRAQGLVEESIRTVHQFARDLRPSVLDDLGLNSGLHAFVSAVAKRTGLHIHLQTVAAVERLNMLKRTVLFRVAQEAVTNVVHHAHATRVHIRLERTARFVHMTVEDNGRSFPVKQALGSGKSARLGLIGMRERVEMVGGQFRIESSPDSGTAVYVQIPCVSTRKQKGSSC